jgi:hypothetical protein
MVRKVKELFVSEISISFVFNLRINISLVMMPNMSIL